MNRLELHRYDLCLLLFGVFFAACSAAPTDGDSPPTDKQSLAVEDDATEAAEEGEQRQGHDHHDHHEHHDHHGDDHSGHHDHRFDDPERYAERWNDPDRDRWQKPEDIIEAMEIEEAMTVADIGAGTGYFVPFLSEAVGEEGRVFAVDIEASMIEYMDDMIADAGLENVETLLADPDDSGLPTGEIDRIVTINTWHHIADRKAYSQHLLQRLDDGGSVWVVDYHEESPVGPPVEYRIPAEVVVSELEAGGFSAEVVDIGLERQYVVVGRTD